MVFPAGMDEYSRNQTVDTCLLQRVRQAILGAELIDWADTNFASLLELLDVIHLEDASQMKDGAIYVSDLANMVRWHERRRTSHVLMTSLDENWGAFSSDVPNRTYPQGNWDDRVIAGGRTPEAVRQYLDDPAVRAVVTPQHTAFWHPRILSLPIGIHNPQILIDHLDDTDGEKRQDLLINNNAWVGGDRERINDRVIANFGGRLRNTYGLSQASFYESVIHSKFVLCPSGMGMDTHRLWETLILGSIPVVEYSPGWDAVLDDLPTLFVADFDEVTPELLATEYPKIVSRCARYDYRKLTKEWWVKGIKSLLNAREPVLGRGTAPVSSTPVALRHASGRWIAPVVLTVPAARTATASRPMKSGTVRAVPPHMNLFVVFHDRVDPDMFDELDETERQCFTLYGVKNRQASPPLRTVYEQELPVYNPRLQANKYNEGSALYHVHANGLAGDSGYVGFFHYDMKFCKGAITAVKNTILRSPNTEHVFATSLFTHTPFVGGQTSIVTDYPEHDLVGGLKSYNDYFGTSFSSDVLVTTKMLMRNAFIVSTQLYKKMMDWMKSYFVDDISDHLYEPVDDDYFNPGHVIEALTGMFLALEVAQNAVYRRIHIHLETGHDPGFPNDTTHA